MLFVSIEERQKKKRELISGLPFTFENTILWKPYLLLKD